MPTAKCSASCGKWSMWCSRLQALTCKSKWELVASCRGLQCSRDTPPPNLPVSAPCPWTSRGADDKAVWGLHGTGSLGLWQLLWTSVHCPVFLNSFDGTSHLWGLFSLELEESEDVEKINRAAKGWGQRERGQVACSRDYVPGLRGGWDCRGTVSKEAGTGGAGAPRTARLYFQSGVCHSPSRAHKPSLAGVCDGRVLG